MAVGDSPPKYRLQCARLFSRNTSHKGWSWHWLLKHRMRVDQPSSSTPKWPSLRRVQAVIVGQVRQTLHLAKIPQTNQPTSRKWSQIEIGKTLWRIVRGLLWSKLVLLGVVPATSSNPNWSMQSKLTTAKSNIFMSILMLIKILLKCSR